MNGTEYVPGQFDDISDEDDVPQQNTDQILSQIMLEKLSGKYQTAYEHEKGKIYHCLLNSQIWTSSLFQNSNKRIIVVKIHSHHMLFLL